MIFSATLSKLFSEKTLLFVEFLFLDQAGEPVKEALTYVLRKCGIDEVWL